MSFTALTPVLLFIYYHFDFQTTYVNEVQKLNNYCIFLMLLHYPFFLALFFFFRVFAQGLHFIQVVLLQKVRELTVEVRKELP